MKTYVAMRRLARWLALLCTMAALCPPFGTGKALAEAVITENTGSIAQATPHPSQGDFVGLPVIVPSPEGQETAVPPVISEAGPAATTPPETEGVIVENLPVIDEPVWEGDIGIVPPIADEILLPWVEDAFPPSLQVLQQEKPTVMAGDTFDLPLYIDFIFNGQSNVTNKGMDTGEALAYMQGSDSLQRYDQGIASQIDYATLSLPTEWNENGALVLDFAYTSGEVVGNGNNRGYAVVTGLQVPASAQPGQYTLALKVTWRVNAPLAEEQIVYVSIPYEVVAPAEAVMPFAGVEWGDGIIVYSHEDLINAVANTAYGTIYLGYSEANQGVIAYQKRQPMAIGRNLVIDGTDPLTGYRMRLQDWNSSGAQDGMYASASGITVTFRRIDLTVQNYYGIMYGTGQKNVNLEFIDVNARGRQLAHTANTGSSVTFTDCTVLITNVGSGTEQEVLEAPNVTFYGRNVMTRTGPTDHSMFWLNGDSSLSFTVTEGASLTLDTTNYMIYTGNSAATTMNVYGDLSLATAGPNGSATYADQYVGKLSIHPQGSMIVQHNSSTRSSLLVKDLTVSGRLEIRRMSSASAVIRLESGGSFVADNPSLILLDNPGGSILRSLGAATLRWNVVVINRYSGGSLAAVWNRQDLACFTVALTHSGNNAVVQSVSNLDNDGKGAAIGAAALSGTLPLGQDTHLAMGKAVLSLDTVYAGQSQVTGQATSGAALTIAEYEYTDGKLGGQIQQQTTTANARYTVVLANAVQLTGSRVYAISDDGVLVAYTYQGPQQSGPMFVRVPDTLAFETVGLSSEDQLVHRVDSDWSIEVFDGRSNGEGFTLFASIDAPLTTASGDRLEDGLVFVENGQTQPLDAVDWPVYQSGESGLTTMHTIGWQADEGLLVNLPAFEGVAGEPYTATITWTLAVGP